ncbi:MAG: hypothetical protein IE926_02000 [Micrococcales bacterium]|nr:hypothetical protein [Micrococcales bacterium]
MTTHVTTHNPVRSDLAPEAGPATTENADTPSRLWSIAGIGAGVAALAAGVSAGMIDPVYDETLRGDAEGILQKLTTFVPHIAVFQVTASIAAVLFVVFGLGLARRLRVALPVGHLAPAAAAAGLVGTAVVLVMGSALNTEFLAVATKPEIAVPEAAAFYNHWTGTVPGCWLLVGLSALAVHAAARAGGVPRWPGRTGLVLGGLTLLVGTLPVQYMAGLTGLVWLLVTAIGFHVGDRGFRRGR